MITTGTRISLVCGLIALLMMGVVACKAVELSVGGPQEIEAAMKEYEHLQLTKDAVGLSDFYTTDGELLEPGMEPLKGREAIRKFLDSFGDVKIDSASMTSTQIEVWRDKAIQWGTYAQRVELPDKPAGDFHGRFVAEWSKQPSGRWLIRRLLTQPT